MQVKILVTRRMKRGLSTAPLEKKKKAGREKKKGSSKLPPLITEPAN
jgi:hypothetical protein